MIFITIAATSVAAFVGTSIVVSLKRFKNNLFDADCKLTMPLAKNESLTKEINRFDQLKTNLATVKMNVKNLDIPMPDTLNYSDDTESSLNKINAFFEKNSKCVAGTEAFILSILPTSQVGESLSALTCILPEIGGKFLTAFQQGAGLPSIETISDISKGFWQHFIAAHPTNLTELSFFGVQEISGYNAAVDAITSPEMTAKIGDSMNVDGLTDITDFDMSGHIPFITIAISSFREIDLLLQDKTDTMTSLKNIGLDAVGTGGGGLVGAKAGAILGSAFGPVGTLVGGIIGGVGGAIGGRAITNNIKQEPLLNAIKEYQTNADRMKSEALDKSRNMHQEIYNYASSQRNKFKNDNRLYEIPVIENEGIVDNIALIIYQALKDHIASMRKKVEKMKSSFWYSEKKYGSIVENYQKRIEELEHQLPLTENVKNNSRSAIESLLALQIPVQKKDPIYQKKLEECSNELQNLNDKNNSSVLIWSYMVNGLYQKTINEIVIFSNNKMKDFNQFISDWKETLSMLEKKVNIEKDKLGIA